MTVQLKKLNEKEIPKAYKPTEKDGYIKDFLTKRIDVLKKTKKNILGGVDFEQIMKDADKEYQPKAIKGTNANPNSTIITVQDEDLGLRGSRFVQINPDGENWRSDLSAPTLLVKIQTALSILIDQNPESVFTSTRDAFKKKTDVIKSLYKRNWELPANGLDVTKLFVFDLAKYGWAIGHTVPRLLKREKEILDIVDTEHPENNKYRKVEITEFNDVYREKLDPFRTWIDDKTNLADPYSMNDWYYEKDYSKDDFLEEFGKYKNSEMVEFGSIAEDDENKTDSETKTRDDMVTVGFYENKKKDLYTIWIPNQSMPLYYSPLPNDDGKLTCWWSYWVLRDPRTPYGIGLYELIKNDKVMYDKFKNMTVDQVVMAIYPMLFFTGTPMDGANEIRLAPNKIGHKQPGTNIDQVKITFDPRGPEQIEAMKTDMDESTGITPTLQGEVGGKTLGEVLHAKDAALKRLNIPLNNIANAIEQDAYITISWMKQIYSIPEVKEFVDEKELERYQKELGVSADKITTKESGKIEAQFYPELNLNLSKDAEDRDGVLIESPESRFFQLGVEKGDIKSSDLVWEGNVTIKAKSVISPNPEIERQRKTEVYNVVSPQIQVMASLFYQHVDPKTGETYTPEGGKDVALAMYPSIKQILEVNDEKPESWVFPDLLELADNPQLLEQQKAQEAKVQKEADAAKPENQLFVGQDVLDAKNSGGTPPASSGSPTGAPMASPVVAPSSLTNQVSGMMGDMKGAETKALQG